MYEREREYKSIGLKTDIYQKLCSICRKDQTYSDLVKELIDSSKYINSIKEKGSVKT